MGHGTQRERERESCFQHEAVLLKFKQKPNRLYNLLLQTI